MKCVNHYAEVDYKYGYIHCPLCGKRMSDEEARECLREIFITSDAVEFAFKYLKSICLSIIIGRDDRTKQIILSRERQTLKKDFIRNNKKK